MKMKMNMALVAGALALSLTGQAANAQIVSNAGLADQLILSVWDSVTGASYTQGLGLNGTSLISLAGINFGAATTGSQFSATGSGSGIIYSQAADATLTSFLAGETMSNLVWNVIGGDTNAVIYGTNGFLTTSTAMATTTDSAIGSMNSVPGYVQSANSLMSQTALGSTDSIVAPSGSNASAPSGLSGFVANAPFSSTAALGSSQNFFLLTPTTGSRGYNGNALSYQFATTTGNAWTVSMATNGNLTIAAVPEPGEWLLMLSGLGLIGFIATRRRNNAGSMTFA